MAMQEQKGKKRGNNVKISNSLLRKQINTVNAIFELFILRLLLDDNVL